MQGISPFKYVDRRAHYSVSVNVKSLHICIYCSSVIGDAQYNVPTEYLTLPYTLFVDEVINTQKP